MTPTASELPIIDDAWIVERRGTREQVDPRRPYACHVELERAADGRVDQVATIFITNRECPFRCLMCDLWKNTTVDRVEAGAVADQIESALSKLPPARHVKLYNSGNFFDQQAIPRDDLPHIARLVAAFETVIVECHPRLIDRRCIDFADSLHPALEVAMGLETVDSDVLTRLNKRMALSDYERATRFLLDHDIAIRAFILLRTPFQSEQQGIEWAKRSIDYAFSIGVECCAVVPTRSGNGALDWLEQRGLFTPPSLASMEAVLDYGIGLARGRVFMDTWDIERFVDCPHCGPRRTARLKRMNMLQRVEDTITCSYAP